MCDLIDRQAAIDVVRWWYKNMYGEDAEMWICESIEDLPSAQPEITDEQAIEHLQSTGWMQNHDREMYDMGLKKQLADDSGSYDSLLPPAEPEIIRCKDCKYWNPHNKYCEGIGNWFGIADEWSDNGFCYKAERRIEK